MRALSLSMAWALGPALASAHLFMNSPSPIPGSAPKDPLAADGSNFPCHGVAFPGSGGIEMPVGSSQLLNFGTGGGYNTAVHGGGSCQIAITYETDARKIRNPANWYVIMSIEGGCPTNTLANLDGSYTGPDGNTYSGSKLCNDTSTNGFDCINAFQFNIPRGMMNGQATLAWTWFNTIGNRELYMNCAAISISGGPSDTSQMQSLPQLFVANLAAPDLPSGCSSSERINIGFPNPGPVLSRRLASSRNFVASASTQYPIGTPAGCPNNARAGVDTSATPSASVVAPSGSSVSPVQGSSPPVSSPVSSSASAISTVISPGPIPGSAVSDGPASPTPPADTTQSSVAPTLNSPSGAPPPVASSRPGSQIPSQSPSPSPSRITPTTVRTTAVKTSTKSKAPAATCNAKHVAAVNKAKSKKALAFCKKYKKPSGSNKSSIKGVPNAKSLVAACKCIVNGQKTTGKVTKTATSSVTAPASATVTPDPASTGGDGSNTDTGSDSSSTDPGNAGSGTTPPASSPSNACPAGSVPCSKYNDVVCPDSSHYGICDNNMCAVSQAVAPGTACENGQIVAAGSNSNSNSKRSMREHLGSRHIRRAVARI